MISYSKRFLFEKKEENMKNIIIKKQEAVEQLSEKMKKAVSVVAFDYPGLSVESFTELRTKLREAGCEAKVYKNNIARRASEKAGFSALANVFNGPKAIALGYKDVVAPAKILSDFSKLNKQVVLIGSIIEGEFLNQEQTLEVANIPSREVLLTQLAVGLLTPIRELAVGLNMISEEK
jgi:large subunit ribosomal protein L10